jgi:hypothetical protein
MKNLLQLLMNIVKGETRKNTRFNVVQQCVYIHMGDEILFSLYVE